MTFVHLIFEISSISGCGVAKGVADKINFKNFKYMLYYTEKQCSPRSPTATRWRWSHK